MSSLGGSTVSSSYNRLLTLPNGGGDGANLVALSDGDNATTFALRLSTTDISVPGTGKVYLDGGDSTYITEGSSGNINHYSDGTISASLRDEYGELYSSGVAKITIGVDPSFKKEPYGGEMAARVFGALLLGDESSPSGDLLFSGYYSGDGSLVNFSSEYSSGAPEIGFACQASTTTLNKHISTTNNTQYKSALNVSRWLHYRHSNGYSGTTSIAAGSTVELGTIFSIAENGFVGLTLPGYQPDRSTIIEYAGDTGSGNFTIQQGSYDSFAISLKSTDVAHGLTSYAETDTYGYLKKASSAGGGIEIVGLAEDDVSYASPVEIRAFGGQASTSHTTGGNGLIDIYAAEHDGSNTLTDITSQGNVLAVKARRSGSIATIFIVDEDGDLHADGTLAAYDTYDDAHLARAFDTRDNVKGLINSKWDGYVQYNEKTLVDAGILGDTRENGGLTNVTRLQKLHNGAIWQQYEQFQNLLQAFEKVSTEVIGKEATKDLLENNNIKMLGKS